MTLLNKTGKKKKLVHDNSRISITASVSTASDIHLTPDTRHNKGAQNATTAIPREGVLVERHSKKQEQSTSRESDTAAGKSFSLLVKRCQLA